MTEDVHTLARDEFDRIVLLIMAVIMLNFGFRLWGLLPPGDDIAVVITIYTYATALGLLVAAIADLDLTDYGYHIAAWCLTLLLGALSIELAHQPGFGTDALLYSRYSVDLLTTGKNPYAASMLPAVTKYDVPALPLTPTTDGGVITTLSYPAGMVLAFLPQSILLEAPLNLTLLAVSGTVAGFLILESPSTLALLPLIVMLGARNLFLAASGGILDAVWVLPLLVAMGYWHRDAFGKAGLVYGVAAGTKQTVWPIAPLLLIWHYHAATTHTEFWNRVRTTVAAAVSGFLALNLPFLVWNLEAWLRSVFVPVYSTAPMVHQGVGLTLYSVAGVYALPKLYFSILTAAAYLVVVGLYWLYWDRLKWVAWIVPALVLFWYYRSLNSYFTWFLPIAYYAVLCALDLHRPDWGLDDIDIPRLDPRGIGND